MHDKNKCPYCNRGMLLFSSFGYKQCVACNKKFAWNLEEGQKYLIQHQR